MADATLFCTGVFLEQILPNHFGWTYQEVFGASRGADGLLESIGDMHSAVVNGLTAYRHQPTSTAAPPQSPNKQARS